MKGFGTDESAITNVLGHRTTQQRLQIKLTYKTLYGKDLVSSLHSELSGNYRRVVMALMRSSAERDAYWLRKGMKGMGTDESALIEILCTRENDEIKEIVAAYKQEYSRDLEKDVISETSGHFKRLLVSMVQANRPSSSLPIDHAKAKEDAAALYKAGVKRFGTDESTFNKIMCTRSYEQLRATFNEYEKICKYDMETTIKREMSGDLKDGMLALVKVVQHRPTYFAECLYKSMKGLGTDDLALVRAIVSRAEIDMGDIKDAFQAKYGKSLASFIKGDTSGDYRKILMALIGE
eukprot:m.34621 g.34621  ORF g.34621 m.34621 type:complete len:293 (-) comp5679_c0_seq1:111-989(-)